MNKFKLYAIVLCSSLLCAPAHAINEGNGGGRGALGEDGRDGGSSGDAMRGAGPAYVTTWESEGTPETDDSSFSGDSDLEAGTRGVQSDSSMRQSTGDWERGSNAPITHLSAPALVGVPAAPVPGAGPVTYVAAPALVGDRATGSSGVSLGHHSDSFEADGYSGPISHGRDH